LFEEPISSCHPELVSGSIFSVLKCWTKFSMTVVVFFIILNLF